MSEFEHKTNSALVGKTVKSADINGHGITIEFTDGTVFDYDATDGGYSCWRVENNGRLVCGYNPEEALVAQCSTCRFFKKKHSYCTMNDSLTNAKYKCSGWKLKTNTTRMGK